MWLSGVFATSSSRSSVSETASGRVANASSRFAPTGPDLTGPAVLVARLAPEKDIGTLLRAAAMVACYIGAAYWFTASTSFANPAAAFGRMFSDSFAGIAPGSVAWFVA